jgi:hypothetical protein
MLLASKMLLQVAAQDIGQLTDIDCARAAALRIRLPPASLSRDQGGMREPFGTSSARRPQQG